MRINPTLQKIWIKTKWHVLLIATLAVIATIGIIIEKNRVIPCTSRNNDYLQYAVFLMDEFSSQVRRAGHFEQSEMDGLLYMLNGTRNKIAIADVPACATRAHAQFLAAVDSTIANFTRYAKTGDIAQLERDMSKTEILIQRTSDAYIAILP